MAAPQVKMKNSKFAITVIALILLSAGQVSAFWRLECRGQLGVARVDPIMSPDKASNHAHVAQDFAFDTNIDNMLTSNCTSCSVTQDRSLYWSPAMYFKHHNNTFQLVNTVGGMLAYYFNNNVAPGNESSLTAFPPGFRMIAGDMVLRGPPPPTCNFSQPMSLWGDGDWTQLCLTAKSIGFNCMNYSPSFKPEGSLEYNYLRPKNFTDEWCVDGIRTELQFPSCWDGVNLDSPDHKSHIVYPPQMKTGVCPPTHPVRTPVLFYETIWDTYPFKNYSGEYVMSYGDPTGYGYHGDFIAGWNQSFLQKALENCTSTYGYQSDCLQFDLQDQSIQQTCQMPIPESLEEEVFPRLLSRLPGDIAIQPGPANATINMGPSQTGGTTQAITSLASTTVGESYTTTTSTFISTGVEVVMVIVEELKTLTVTSTEIVQLTPTKRHVHRHVRGGHRI